MKCMECGAQVPTGQYHDYIECVRYRWDQRPASKDKTDVMALLCVIDGTPRPGK